MSDTLVFCERKSDLLIKKNELLPSIFCHEQPERIALLSWATWANRSWLLFFKEKRYQIAQVAQWGKESKNCQKHTKNMNFEQIACFFRAIGSNHEQITDIALFKRAHRSRLLFKISNFEQKSEEQMRERANSQPCLKHFVLFISEYTTTEKV